MCHFSLNVQACSSIFWDDEPNDDHMFEVVVNPSTKYRCVFGIGGHIMTNLYSTTMWFAWISKLNPY